MHPDRAPWTDPELSYLLEHGARMDADRERAQARKEADEEAERQARAAEREARAAEKAYEEEFRIGLDRLEADAEVDVAEVVPWESPTGVLCSRCRMPATRYQPPTLELVLGVWSAPLALCGVCSELTLRRAHELGDTGQDYEEWRRELEADQRGRPGRVGMLTPQVLEAHKGRYATSTTCRHPDCAEEGIAFIAPGSLRGEELDQALKAMKRDAEETEEGVERFCDDHCHQALKVLEQDRRERARTLTRQRGTLLARTWEELSRGYFLMSFSVVALFAAMDPSPGAMILSIVAYLALMMAIAATKHRIHRNRELGRCPELRGPTQERARKNRSPLSD